MEADKTDVIFFFFNFYVWKEFLDIIGMWEKIMLTAQQSMHFLTWLVMYCTSVQTMKLLFRRKNK